MEALYESYVAVASKYFDLMLSLILNGSEEAHAIILVRFFICGS